MNLLLKYSLYFSEKLNKLFASNFLPKLVPMQMIAKKSQYMVEINGLQWVPVDKPMTTSTNKPIPSIPGEVLLCILRYWGDPLVNWLKFWLRKTILKFGLMASFKPRYWIAANGCLWSLEPMCQAKLIPPSLPPSPYFQKVRPVTIQQTLLLLMETLLWSLTALRSSYSQI